MYLGFGSRLNMNNQDEDQKTVVNLLMKNMQNTFESKKG